MQDLIGKVTLEVFKIAHGSYNACVLFFFLYQGIVGLRIRYRRKRGLQTFDLRKRHRKLGPFLVILGTSGFVFGMLLVYIGYSRFIKNPLHFFTGLGIVSFILGSYFISKKIKGESQQWRSAHLAAGIVILSLYCIQVFIGLGILL